ncbi:MAG TPA: TRIC cation channel family protein [Lapillicoccus sp.]|jgi:uncharacterized membrane protein YeiH
MPSNPVVSPLLLDLIGVFAFALSGGLVAVRKRLDLFGVLVLAGATGLGGGVLRDLLIGFIPPIGISDWRLVATALAAGLVTFAYHPGVERLGRLVKVLDAVGLAVFAVGGALLALARPGIPPLAAIIVGTVTAVGGGALRDVLVGQVPEVLRRELYALPALLGSAAVVVAYEVGFISPFVVWGAAALVFGIRMVAVVLHLNAPQPFRLGEPR